MLNKNLSTCVVIAILMVAGCKVSEPGKMETSVAQAVKHQVTVGGKEWVNPIAKSPEAIQGGKEHFLHHCQICHGNDGQNTGVPFATKMSPPVADLKAPDVQGYTDGQLKWIIENGIEPSGMPGWKGILEDDEMWKMVHYIRNLPTKGSLGAPEIFKEDAEAHEELRKGVKPAASGAKPHTHTHTHQH